MRLGVREKVDRYSIKTGYVMFVFDDYGQVNRVEKRTGLNTTRTSTSSACNSFRLTVSPRLGNSGNNRRRGQDPTDGSIKNKSTDSIWRKN